MARYHQTNPHVHFAVDTPHIYCVVVIQTAIAETRRTEFLNLDDSEVLAGLKNAKKNLETADTGLIYEHLETSPRVQALSKHIREKLDKLSDSSDDLEHISRSTMLDALSLEIERVEAHLTEGGDGRAYLRFISLFVPWEKKQHDEAKQLIVL